MDADFDLADRFCRLRKQRRSLTLVRNRLLSSKMQPLIKEGLCNTAIADRLGMTLARVQDLIR